MTKLQKNSGHLVSPKDNNLVIPQKKYPKEANDVQFEYSTVLPLLSSPYYPAMGFVGGQ